LPRDFLQRLQVDLSIESPLSIALLNDTKEGSPWIAENFAAANLSTLDRLANHSILPDDDL